MNFVTYVIVATVLMGLILGSLSWLRDFLKRHTAKSTQVKIKKAILESLKDGPLSREKVIAWLEEGDTCDHIEADDVIDMLVRQGFVEEKESHPEYAYTTGGDDDEDEEDPLLHLTEKGRRKVLPMRKPVKKK